MIPGTDPMKHLTLYFDPASADSREVFDRLPQWLEGWSVEVAYRPVSGARLSPPVLTALPIALACQPADATPSRWVCAQWVGAADEGDTSALRERWLAVWAACPSRRAVLSEGQALAELAEATRQAQAQGVLQWPAVLVDEAVVQGLRDIERLRDAWVR